MHGMYKVVCKKHDWKIEVEANTVRHASELAAKEAWAYWAWEVSGSAYPMELEITHPLGVVYAVVVDMEQVPSFYVVKTQQIADPRGVVKGDANENDSAVPQ